MRNKSGGLKFSAVNYPDPETKRGKLLKIDGSKMNFPFGARPIFRGFKLSVSGKVGGGWFRPNWKNMSQKIATLPTNREKEKQYLNHHLFKYVVKLDHVCIFLRAEHVLKESCLKPPRRTICGCNGKTRPPIKHWLIF